jgi:hypothetical protein
MEALADTRKENAASEMSCAQNIAEQLQGLWGN